MSKSEWKSNPTNSEWNDAENWDPSGVPSDEAVFSSSEKTGVTLSSESEAQIDTIEFTSEASPFTFTIGNSPQNTALTINKGVVNNSAHTQTFVVASNGVYYKTPQMQFTGNANAGGNNMMYQAGPTSLYGGYGGGIIAFTDDASAGSASFVARTGAVRPPEKGSTVGAEISFSDRSTAGTGQFKSYGSLQPKTGKIDGDTFGNIVFHDETTAAHGTFISAGGTVDKGDGGNTQFYNTSNAANGTFINYGAVTKGANGGATVFDGNANGGNGIFHNYAATAEGGNGGVVSFNNNPPPVTQGGSSAGKGTYHNYGAQQAGHGGGGHIEFSAVHGSPTADQGTFHNYGSILEASSTAGHTIFSIQIPTEYYPTGGNAVIYNHPALAANGAAGHTEFAVYKKKKKKKYDDSESGNDNYSDSSYSDSEYSEEYSNDNDYPKQTTYPTAGQATIHNLGGTLQGAAGGYTSFSGKTDAGNATLIALAGTNGGQGGRIVFGKGVDGNKAQVTLYGNAVLDISAYNGTLTIESLTTQGGNMITQTGDKLSTLQLSDGLTINSGTIIFSFSEDGGTFEYGASYTILMAPNLSDFETSQFSWEGLKGVQATFSIEGNNLNVSFQKE
jgi:hypothetical protein